MDANTVVLISGVVSLVTVVVLLVVISKLVALNKGLQRLSEQIPGTSMTAKELANELGGSIESSFQKFMPQPDKVSAAITGAVEASLKTALKGVDDVSKKVQDSQGAILDKWSAHEKSSAASLDGIKKSLEDAAAQLGTGLTGGSEKLQASLVAGSKQMTDALTAGSAKLEASLKDHAEKTAQASQQLSAQLDKIAALAKEIDKLLHLQQATEGTIKGVSSSEEFKKLVATLNSHLDTSDKAMKELLKPRQIRLVEEG